MLATNGGWVAMPSEINRRPTSSVRGVADGERAGPRKDTRDVRHGPGTQGRDPSDKPDVFLHVPDVHVGEIYLDVEDLDAHLSLQARLANLVQLVAGVHVHIGKVELDIKDVDAEALLKVRLENLYAILDRALSTIDRNPEILLGLLNTVDTAVGDVGETARQAVKPGGAVSELAGDVGEAGKEALGPGGVATEAVDKVGDTAQEAVGPEGAVSESASAVGRAADDVGEAVSGAAGEAGQGAREAARRTGDVAAHAADGRPERGARAAPDRRGRPHAAGQPRRSGSAGSRRRAPAPAGARGSQSRRDAADVSRRSRD